MPAVEALGIRCAVDRHDHDRRRSRRSGPSRARRWGCSRDASTSTRRRAPRDRPRATTSRRSSSAALARRRRRRRRRRRDPEGGVEGGGAAWSPPPTARRPSTAETVAGGRASRRPRDRGDAARLRVRERGRRRLERRRPASSTLLPEDPDASAGAAADGARERRSGVDRLGRRDHRHVRPPVARGARRRRDRGRRDAGRRRPPGDAGSRRPSARGDRRRARRPGRRGRGGRDGQGRAGARRRSCAGSRGTGDGRGDRPGARRGGRPLPRVAAAGAARPAHDPLVRAGRRCRDAVVEAAVAAACTAPAPHHTRPWAFVALDGAAVSSRAAGGDRRRPGAIDLRGDGTPEEVIERRIARSDAVLGAAPTLIVPFVRFDGAHPYPDEERAGAEREMFLLAGGAAIQTLLLALHAQGVASCWISSTLSARRRRAPPSAWTTGGTRSAPWPAARCRRAGPRGPALRSIRRTSCLRWPPPRRASLPQRSTRRRARRHEVHQTDGRRGRFPCRTRISV